MLTLVDRKTFTAVRIGLELRNGLDMCCAWWSGPAGLEEDRKLLEECRAQLHQHMTLCNTHLHDWFRFAYSAFSLHSHENDQTTRSSVLPGKTCHLDNKSLPELVFCLIKGPHKRRSACAAAKRCSRLCTNFAPKHPCLRGSIQCRNPGKTHASEVRRQQPERRRRR